MKRANPTAPASLLGGLSVDDFMRRHWQRKPLLIRQAIPGFVPPVDPAGLIELAADDEVESRLIRQRRGRWSLEHGPFEAERLPALDTRNWTLLVQGVDLHLDSAHALLSRFRFVPDARLDDLMISLAGDRGGVGPHLDSYDVFLLQAWGRRRWRIGPVAWPKLVDGLPLKILEGFEPDEEWVLEPGDMLYLPPGWGHDGIADGPCMTCSIGFRAPSRHEFLAAFLAEAADSPGGTDPRFGDRARPPAISPAELPTDLADTLQAWATGWRPHPSAVKRFVGRYLTEPKSSVWFDGRRPPAPLAWRKALRRHGLRLDRRSRMLWHGPDVFINGECVDTDAVGRRLLRRLADERRLPSDSFAALADEHPLFELLRGWLEAGWVVTNG